MQFKKPSLKNKHLALSRKPNQRVSIKPPLPNSQRGYPHINYLRLCAQSADNQVLAMVQLHPASVLAAIMSTLALISTIPLCLLLVTTSVAGLPTEDPTSDLFDRSLPLETQSWNYESTCQPRKGQCQVGTYTTQDTVTQNNTATLSLFDQTCKKIGNKG